MNSHIKIFLAATISLATGLTVAALTGEGQFKTAASSRLVSNPEKPRDGIVTPKITELWSAGDGSDASGILLSRPFEVRVADDGNVLVLDWTDTCIRVFDDKGKFVRTIGRKGQGPGDIETPCWFDIDAAGDIFLTDMRNMRVSRFDKNGNFLTSFRVEKPAADIRVDKSGRLYMAEIGRGEPVLTKEYTKIQQTLTIVRCSTDGKNTFRIGPFQADVMMMKRIGDTMISGSSPMAPQTGWNLAPDGRLWAGYNGTYEIGVYDPDGNPLFRFGRAYRPEKNAAMARVTGVGGAVTTQEEFLPAFAWDFIFDDAGNGWFRMYQNEPDEKDKKAKSEPYRYDVFSPEGVYLKQIVVPFRIYQVRKDRMYAIVENEEGFRVLKCYRFD